jgi:uncharacterized NAD(P)/FAD-binding protein YdhS
MQVAIVGLGPWGLCLLATLLRHAWAGAFDDLTVHAIDPNPPGTGAHSPDQPDYFLLNTVSGQVDLFASARGAGSGTQIVGPTLCEWLEAGGYRMAGDDCVLGAVDGRSVDPHDFVPRSVFGRYLAAVYERLAAACPPKTAVIRHRAAAVDIRACDSQESVILADGRAFTADHVFLTTGHTGNTAAPAFAGMLEPYPAAAEFPAIAAGERVAVAGMGLVAVDVVTALTTGRGGRFETDRASGRLRYLQSGREPRIALFTRRGLPFCCRPATSMDTTGSYGASVCTPEAVLALRRDAAQNGGLDFRADVLPLIYGEMTLLFYVRRALAVEGPAAAAEWQARLADAWSSGHFETAIARAATRLGSFEPAEILFGPNLSAVADSRAYQQLARHLLVRDCAESAKGEGASALKATSELFRVLRDQIRDAVEFGGLTPASHRDFTANVAGMITRLVVGPPLRRGREFVALMDAGIVRLPFGPAPTAARDAAGGAWSVSSTRLIRPHTERFAHAVAGFLDPPSVSRTTSRLIANLARAGRLRAFRPNEAGEGVDVDRHAHPLDRQNRSAQRLWVLGPLTEGARYFTHYLPSPKSRYRAFEDAEACVGALLEQTTRIAA